MNRALRPLLVLALGLPLPGCAFSEGNPQGFNAAQGNTCSSSAECGERAVCQDSRCVSTQVDLTGMILEVRPTLASFGASTSYLLFIDDKFTHRSAPEGVRIQLDANLPEPISISGGMVNLDYASECALPPNRSYPVKLTLDRVTDFSGFQFEPYVIESKMKDGTMEYELNGSVPPGRYNVYIEPKQVEGCVEPPPPPVFYANQDLTRKSPSWSVPKPKTLLGDIVPPVDADLTGFRLDVVEHDTGRVISTTQVLETPAVGAPVGFELRLVRPEDATISPYLRLRPPEVVTRPPSTPTMASKPSVYWDLLAAFGASPDESNLHLFLDDLITTPRTVGIRIRDEHDQGVTASVKIQSTKLSGDVASNASYGSDVLDTDAEGSLTTQLPPGKYRLRITPKPKNTADLDSKLAITEDSLEVASPTDNDPGDTCSCGHEFVIAQKTELKGRIETLSGAPLINTRTLTEPSQVTGALYWDVVHALDPLLPDSASAISDMNGAFQLNIDPGASSDFSVRPGEDSGFPWLVRPRVTPKLTDAELDLGALKVSAPVFLEGIVRDPSQHPVGGASIYAWVPVHEATAAGGLSGTVIKIAEITTDEQGHFELTLPASISQ